MTAPRPSPRLLLVWTLLILAVAYLVALGGGGANGIYFTEFRIAGSTIVVVATTAWLIAAFRNEFWRPRSAIWLAFVASLGAMAISVVASSQPRLGFDFVAYGLLGTLAYLILQRLFAHPYFGPRFSSLPVLLAFGFGVLYVIVVVIHWITIWVELGHLVAPPLRPDFESLGIGDPSGLAIVVIVLSLGAAAQLGVGTPTRRRLVASLFLVGSVAVFLTGSRSAWVGVAATVVIVAAFWLWSPARRADIRTLVASTTFRVATVAAVLAALGATPILLAGVSSRLGEPAGDTRTAFARASINMFEADPLTGLGAGTWPVERIRYTDPPDIDYYIPHAHNIALQIAAELGLAGIAAAAVVALLLFRLALRAVRSDDPLRRRLGWATIVAGVYLVAQQMFSLYANTPVVWFCYALIVARLDALTTSNPATMKRRSFAPLGLAIAVGIALSGGWLAFSESASANADRAVAAADAGDWAAALDPARRAAAQDPTMPPYLFTLGLAEARARETQSAIRDLQAAAQIDDYPIAWIDVAWLEKDSGNVEDAKRSIGEAMRLGYQQPQVAFAASLMLDGLGDQSGAVNALADALVVAPTMASDPWWSGGSRKQLLDDALTAALAQASPAVAYRLALEGGRTELAAGFIAELPTDQQRIPRLFTEAWLGDTAAFEQLHALAVANPFDTDTVVLCRRLAIGTRDTPGIPAYSCDGAGTPDNALIVRVNEEGGVMHAAPAPGMPGPDASIHFLYAYRRLAPLNKLVPGMTPLVPVFG